MIVDFYESCSSLSPKIYEYNKQWPCTRPHQDGTFAAQWGASYWLCLKTMFTIGCTLLELRSPEVCTARERVIVTWMHHLNLLHVTPEPHSKAMR